MTLKVRFVGDLNKLAPLISHSKPIGVTYPQKVGESVSIVGKKEMLTLSMSQRVILSIYRSIYVGHKLYGAVVVFWK